MTTARPMLDDLELELVQTIETDEDQVLVQHDVPALEGDFLQGLDRRATQFTLTGVLTGPEVADGLKKLRDKFRAAEPVSFVADIATATQVDQVLIEEMGVRELAGRPERFEYAFTLREYTAPADINTEETPDSGVDQAVTEDATQQTDETVDQIDENAADLTVTVTLTTTPQDFTNLVVHVEGNTEAGEDVFFTIEAHENGVYTRENVPAGEYVVKVVRR